MKLLVTGGSGFLGGRLIQTLLSRGQLAHQPIEHIQVLDQYALPPHLQNHPLVTCLVGDLNHSLETIYNQRFDGVFHLASAVSGECELDFDLGLRANLDATRKLLDLLRHQFNTGLGLTRLVFSSSIAVFGPDPWAPLPAWVADHTLPCPQTSYGVHKLICEQLVADYTRKGYIFGNSARLMTVVVRPGKPNGAASSFFSGILREPLAGEMAICPVSPEVRHPISSPQATVDGLIRIFESNSETLKSRLAINLPALNVSVAEMLQALENVAGHKVRQLVHFKRDDRIAQIVANWPQAAEFSQASRLGLFPPSSIEEIINQYIADYLPTRPFF